MLNKRQLTFNKPLKYSYWKLKKPEVEACQNSSVLDLNKKKISVDQYKLETDSQKI